MSFYVFGRRGGFKRTGGKSAPAHLSRSFWPWLWPVAAGVSALFGLSLFSLSSTAEEKKPLSPLEATAVQNTDEAGVTEAEARPLMDERRANYLVGQPYLTDHTTFGISDSEFSAARLMFEKQFGNPPVFLEEIIWSPSLTEATDYVWPRHQTESATDRYHETADAGEFLFNNWTDEELAAEIKAWEAAVSKSSSEVNDLKAEKRGLRKALRAARKEARSAKTVLFNRYRTYFHRNINSEKADPRLVFYIISLDESYDILQWIFDEAVQQKKEARLNRLTLDADYEETSKALTEAEAELQEVKELSGDVGAAESAEAKASVDEKERDLLDLQAKGEAINNLLDVTGGFHDRIDNVADEAEQALTRLISDLLPLYREFHSQAEGKSAGKAVPPIQSDDKDG